MKLKELLWAGLVYAGCVTLAYFLFRSHTDDAAGAAQAGGTGAAVFVAASQYQLRNEAPAPAKVKLTVGAALAAVCLVLGLLFQRQFAWMVYPDIGIGFGMLGAFVFPFLLLAAARIFRSLFKAILPRSLERTSGLSPNQ